MRYAYIIGLMKTPTQKEMAEFLGISVQYFSNIKCHHRTLGKRSAVRIYKRKKISIEEFKELQFSTGDKFVRLVKRAMKRARSKRRQSAEKKP